MTRAELKQQAKDSLRGRWGTAIGMFLLFQIVTAAISMFGAIGAIASIVITVPLSFGYIGQILKFSRKEEVGVADFFNNGFNNFRKSWAIAGNTILKLLPYILGMFASIVLLVFSIIYTTQNEDIEMFYILIAITYIIFFVFYFILIAKSYLYMLPEYIGNDTDSMTANEIVERSAELMKGHRWELFVLELSFIGWAILAVFSCGIGLLWLTPYMEVTTAKFYDYVAGINQNNNNDVIVENN